MTNKFRTGQRVQFSADGRLRLCSIRDPRMAYKSTRIGTVVSKRINGTQMVGIVWDGTQARYNCHEIFIDPVLIDGQIVFSVTAVNGTQTMCTATAMLGQCSVPKL